MKKRIILLIVSILMLIIILVAGCSLEETSKSETIHSEKIQETVGSYYLFQTQYAQEYLNFLENFDETKYEIVDISTSLAVHIDGSDEFYMVTYRVLPEH